MNRDCNRDALLRQLPTPWRKDGQVQELFDIYAPNATPLAAVEITGDSFNYSKTGAAPFTRVPLTGSLYDFWNTLVSLGFVVFARPELLTEDFNQLLTVRAVTLAPLTPAQTITPISGTQKKVTIGRWTSQTWRVLDPFARKLATADANVQVGLDQLNVLTAADFFATMWGLYLGIPRRADEYYDDTYTARIQHELIRPRENNQALAQLLEEDFPPVLVTIVSDTVTACFTPSDDLPLRGRPLRGDHYNVATVEIVTEGAFPSAAMLESAERNVAAGVKVFIRGNYALKSMPSPAGYSMAFSSLLIGVVLPMKIGSPPPISVGKIGPP